ncbi:MAG: long-chain-acyl-CoA synthetase [Pseudomonadota bacterium]
MGFFSDFRENWESVRGFQKLFSYTASISPDSQTLITDDFEYAVDRYRFNAFCRFEGTIWTYDEFERFANRVAHWALGQGLKKGDAVALFMENCPEYIAIWFGLSKVGVVTGLINTNLADTSLAHCINIADAKAVIAGKECVEPLNKAIEHLDGTPSLWGFGDAPEGGEDMAPVLAGKSDERPDRSLRAGLKADALALYVYTSGTTGLPKAARMTHSRCQFMAKSFVKPVNCSQRDRVYITLPLYHSTGGLCGVGTAINTGACIILRRRFSASQFWKQAAEEGATVIVYIGELCRYLINQPESEYDTAHTVRTGFGNGLRPDIWQGFLDRFDIPKLVEFYGSTEGNVSFLNVNGKVGAVGHIPKILESKVEHIRFVKFDVETEMPVRGEDGFCIDAEPGEPAEAIGRLGDLARSKFEGYNDPEATKKKILTDVFETGDLWFRTGDLLRKDEQGYIYFVDRIGDTFRWKGENVSTNEVGGVLSTHPNIELANVYGVPIPGMDGKAGMAAITLNGDFDFEALRGWIGEQLPTYAVPLFLRVQPEAETTGTMKYRKVDLVEDGFNPAKASDPIWFLNPESGQYQPLTDDVYETIISGGFRF